MTSDTPPHDELVDAKTLETAEIIGVFDQDGNERPFGGLVRHGKVCVIFIRHFLCGFCQDYLVALKQKLADKPLTEKKIIVIGCGHWSVIKSYKELLGDCPFDVYSENTTTLFSTLGMIARLDAGDPKTQGHYIAQSLPNTIVNSLLNGWKMGAMTFLRSGKMSQQGGEFIFVDGECVLAHRMRNARDHMEPEDLLERFIQSQHSTWNHQQARRSTSNSTLPHQNPPHHQPVAKTSSGTRLSTSYSILPTISFQSNPGRGFIWIYIC